MDDLLVVILTLAVAGIGILGQFKKKKQAAAGTNQPKQPESFWDLIQGGTEFPIEEEENAEPVISPKTSYNKINFSSEKQSINKNNTTKTSVRKKIRSETMKGFSLRKAVVYSEIINRKYT
ncbi:MAG: hypothetical protein L3J54_03020 [Draconibacterium sp.]|nr:hypothetical protein [Draconibacterium sp.]